MFKKDKRWIWIILGSGTIILSIVFGYFPEAVEKYYSRGIFILIRNIIDYTIALLPIPTIYLLVISILCFIFYQFFLKKREEKTWKKKIGSFLFSMVALLMGLVFFFQFLWGFNYSRIPIEKQLGILTSPLNKEELFKELEISTEELISAYERVKQFDPKYFRNYVLEDDFEKRMRAEVDGTFSQLGYPSPGRVRARQLYPKGILLRISTAGFYLPFVGECHIDAGLHPLQIPYVMSHEFAHGYGIGDEGTCNFIAYLNCKNSSDPILNYTGLLSYWRSIAGQYKQYDPVHYKKFRADIPQGIKDHLTEIYVEMEKYPDIFPQVRDATYNAYLKSQGVEDGIKSYNRVILLVNAYRKQEPKKI